MSRTSTILRFLVSALVAMAILLFGGGWIVHHYIGHESAQTVGLTIIRGINLIADVPGHDKSKEETSPASEKPTRLVAGMVQVAFTVGTDGRAHDIRVLRAIPAGVYEQAARAVIAARHFTPPNSAQGTAVEHTRIVHFQVPADAVKKAEGRRRGHPSQ